MELRTCLPLSDFSDLRKPRNLRSGSRVSMEYMPSTDTNRPAGFGKLFSILVVFLLGTSNKPVALNHNQSTDCCDVSMVGYRVVDS